MGNPADIARVQGRHIVGVSFGNPLVMSKPSLGAILKRGIGAETALRVGWIEHYVYFRTFPALSPALGGCGNACKTVGLRYLGVRSRRAVTLPNVAQIHVRVVRARLYVPEIPVEAILAPTCLRHELGRQRTSAVFGERAPV